MVPDLAGPAQRVRGALSPAAAAVVAALAEIGRRRGERVFLVGGAVRDLLLGRGKPDLDFAVEGDGVETALELGRRLGRPVAVVPRFLNAHLTLVDGLRVDVAATRRERYPRPAALPEVEPAPLREDLARRDFTVNTLALPVAEREDSLIDAWGGLADLRRRRLAILRPDSFDEDPTRILRGVRFERQLGLRFEPATESAARAAVAGAGLRRLSDARLERELNRLVGPPAESLAVLDRLHELGATGSLLPAVRFGEEARRRVARALELARDGGLEPDWRWVATVLASGLAGDRVARFRPPIRADAARRAAAAGAELASPELLPHRAAELFDALAPEEAVSAALAAGEAGVDWLRRYRCELRDLTLTIRGGDLLARGAAAGPELGAALRATLQARRDGLIGAGEELAYALQRLAASPRPEAG